MAGKWMQMTLWENKQSSPLESFILFPLTENCWLYLLHERWKTLFLSVMCHILTTCVLCLTALCSCAPLSKLNRDSTVAEDGWTHSPLLTTNCGTWYPGWLDINEQADWTIHLASSYQRPPSPSVLKHFQGAVCSFQVFLFLVALVVTLVTKIT